MKIQKIDIHNFKRFTSLTIEGIPEKTKLVLLIGENGSGKSSIFDSFEWLSNEKLIDIVAKIATARQHYEAFKMDITNDKSVDSILNDLKSDNFSTFYTYFSMKKFFAKNYLAPLNLTKKQLVSTIWFKNQINNILN